MVSELVMTFDTPEVREHAIGKMLEVLRENMAKAPEDSIDARCAAILMDVLPGFYRALDRERMRFMAEVQRDSALGVAAKDSKAMDALLMVMTLPLINMVVSTVRTMVPSDDVWPSKRCRDLRTIILGNLLDNFRLNVYAMVNQQSVIANGNDHALPS